MQKIALITDSACDLDLNTLKANAVKPSSSVTAMNQGAADAVTSTTNYKSNVVANTVATQNIGGHGINMDGGIATFTGFNTSGVAKNNIYMAGTCKATVNNSVWVLILQTMRFISRKLMVKVHTVL